MVLCLVKQLQVVIPYMGLPGIRSAGNNLHADHLAYMLRVRPDSMDLAVQPPPGILCFLPKVPDFLKQVLPCHVVPVQRKANLKTDGCLPLYFQVGITPVAKLRITGYIFPAYIEASHKTRGAVHHHDFTVVAVIHPQIQPSQKGREEYPYLNPGAAHLVPTLLRHEAASHAVAQDSHFHTFPYLIQKNGDNGVKQFIVLDDIVLDVDKPAGLAQGVSQGFKFCLSVCVYLYLVVHGEHGSRCFQIIDNQALKIPGHGVHHFLRHVVGADDILLAFDRQVQPVADFLHPEHPALFHILAKEQVKDDSEHRDEIQGQKPGPYTSWVPALKKYDNNRKCQVDIQQMVQQPSPYRQYRTPDYFHSTASLLVFRFRYISFLVNVQFHSAVPVSIFQIAQTSCAQVHLHGDNSGLLLSSGNIIL